MRNFPQHLPHPDSTRRVYPSLQIATSVIRGDWGTDFDGQKFRGVAFDIFVSPVRIGKELDGESLSDQQRCPPKSLWFSLVCLLALAFQTIKAAPVLVLANREEAYSRPSSPPQRLQSGEFQLDWVGGIDLIAGGTWLGVNAAGVLVAVTNRRKLQNPPNPRSRGLLCRDLLAAPTASEAHRRAILALQSGTYAGCNFLLADPRTAWVIESGEMLRERQLQPGLHLMSNGDVDDPADARLRRVRQELTADWPSTLVQWCHAGQRICGETATAELPAICLEGTEGGTVSASIIGYGTDASAAVYLHAAGPPSRTPFDDYSLLLRSLLSEPRENAQGPEPHRITLRGPWEYELLDPSQVAGAKSGKARLPDEWISLFGEYRGRIRWKRRFHRPTNLAPHDRVCLVFTGVGGRGMAALNGELLGEITAAPPARIFDITRRLRGEEELVVELEFQDQMGPGGLFGPVVLEIHDGSPLD
jgi:hypothetical protein